MNKGDILQVHSFEIDGIINYIHPFIYWEGQGDKFTGIMLTHSDISNNIPLSSNHFETDFSLTWDKSRFVDQILLKDIDISDKEIKGRLSQEGIKYIEEHISNLKVLTWNEYKEK